MTAPTLFRAYIGPHWRPANNNHAWDWTRTQDFAFADQNARLTTTLSDTVTTASLNFDTAALLPPKGGLWIGPGANTTGQGWEYVDYSSYTTGPRDEYEPPYYNHHLVGLHREPSTTREHNGIHTYGSFLNSAPVHFWAPLSTNDGKLHITEEMDANLCAITWSAEMSGVLAPRGFIRNNHAVLIRTRPGVGVAWSNLLLGWIEEFQIEDDYRRYAKWSLRITSIAGILNRQHCPAIRIGDLDIAQAGKVIKTAQILAHPVKEQRSGDFTESDPDLSGASLIDGNDDTLCIFERVLGAGGRGSGSDEIALMGNVFVGEGNITIPAGLGKGYRWLNFYAPVDRIWRIILARSNRDDAAIIGLQGTAGMGSRIIACENLNRFMAMNPLADPTRIVEIGPAFFDKLNLNPDEGDVLGLGDDNWTGWQGKPIAWGANPPNTALYKKDDVTYSRDRWSDRGWGGFPTPTDGKIFRFIYEEGEIPPHMYQLVDYDTVGYVGDVAPWALIQLPSMGLRLNTAIDNLQTGLIYLTDGTVPTTNGLPTSGTIQIGFEQMSYTAKTATSLTITARAVNGTTAAIHEANDQVLIYEDGQATNAFRLNHLTIWRPPTNNAPKNISIRFANSIVMPRMPSYDDENPDHEWWRDYHTYVAETNLTTHQMTWWTPTRANWLLLQINAMQTQPARPRLNRISVTVDTSTFDSNQWLPEGSTIGDAYEHLFGLLGIPGAAVTNQISNTDPFELLTGAKPAWPTLVDMADYTNTLIAIDYLNKITLRDNIMWDTDVVSGGETTFDRSNARQVTMIQERPGAVKQVKMEWVQTDGSAGGTIVYPDPEYLMGDYKTLKSSIYPSAVLAMASLQRRFTVLRYPATIAIQTAVGDPTLHTGLFYGLNWLFHDGSRAARTGFAQSVDHLLENTNWQTAIRLIALRAAEY